MPAEWKGVGRLAREGENPMSRELPEWMSCSSKGLKKVELERGGGAYKVSL